MYELKPLHKQAIESALEKAKHYRLLNDPENAESICRDILAMDDHHQDAIVALILSLTDQFDGGSASVKEAIKYRDQLESEYDKEYFSGLIFERTAKTMLKRNNAESRYAAYDRFRTAMEHFENAERMSSDDNDDAVLRWNSCARILMKHNLQPRPEDNYVPYGDA